MKKRLKIGLVGVGGISNAHIPAWEKLEEAQLTALCDIRGESMERYPDKKCYTDFDEMLDKENLDIVDICLPTYLHVEYALKALERGIHVLCEKPISLNRQDVARLYEAAQRSHVKFMVAQCVRFWPEYQFVRELFASRRYGRLLSGSMERLGSYPREGTSSWFRDEKRSGLVPYDLHIHDLDFMVDAFGVPKKTHSFRQKTENQDHIHVVYEYDGFAISADTAWYAADFAFKCGFRFQFETAVVELENGTLTVYRKNQKKDRPAEKNEGVDSGYIPQSDAYFNEISYFTQCVLNGTDPDRVRPEQLEAVLDILAQL